MTLAIHLQLSINALKSVKSFSIFLYKCRHILFGRRANEPAKDGHQVALIILVNLVFAS